MSFTTSTQGDKPQPIDRKGATSAIFTAPQVAKDSVYDVKHYKGDINTLRARYSCSRREAIRLFYWGMAAKIVELEQKLEARDGFGKRIGPQAAVRDWRERESAA